MLRYNVLSTEPTRNDLFSKSSARFYYKKQTKTLSVLDMHTYSNLEPFLDGIWEGLEVWSLYEYWIAPVRTAAMRTKPPKVISGIFFLLWGFSLVQISRVVCKAMPLLWSATRSRRLPLDLNERQVSAVPMQFCSDPPQNTHLMELFVINQHSSFI